MTDQSFDLQAALAHDGPLPREAALAALDHAASLMRSADFADAGRLYQRVIGFDDPAVTAAAMLGLGEALHRLDRDDQALATWEEVTRLPETTSTYPAWRNVAAARVRAGDLRGAMGAYREAERRAPQQDRPEIASRLGWLAKETGDTGSAGRYFARARGDVGVSLAVVIVAVTTIVSLLTDFAGAEGRQLLELLALDKPAVAEGEVWRLWTVTLVHAPVLVMPFHLMFNMYALWLAGPIAEQLYGRCRFLVFYLVFALAGSLGTFAFGGSPGGVGASGAIFGLFGLLFAAQRAHHPVVDRQSRAFLGQLGMLLAINLVFGLVVAGIDNLAHIGGLIAGVWLGVLIAPTHVPTLRSWWQRPGEPAGSVGSAGYALGPGGGAVLRVVGLAGLVAFLVFLYVTGLSTWG